MNRQESHRIYLQLFAPRSAPQPGGRAGGGPPTLHRHGSHDVHPPEYPTTPAGGLYRFDSSPDSSQSSYSFSSLSTITTAAPTHGLHNGQANQRVAMKRFVGVPSTATTSAAVRLTDKARARDVTALLRGKFGLPSMPSSNRKTSPSKRESLSGYYSARGDRSPTRLSYVQKDGSKRHGSGSSTNNAFDEIDLVTEEEVDALVLVGTLEGIPRGYLRFEHEELQEEQQRLEVFRKQREKDALILHQETMNPLHPLRGRENSEDTVVAGNHDDQMASLANKMAHLPVSESAATVHASGAEPGWVSSALLASMGSGESSIGLDKSGSEDNLSPLGAPTISSSGAIGLDLSSSRASAALGGWGMLRGDIDVSSPRAGLPTLVSELSPPKQSSSAASHRRVEALPPSQSKSKLPSLCYEQDLEPIHIVRTVLPDEHPLKVRDEMMSKLRELRVKAEEEMGLHLVDEGDAGFQRQYPQPSFRWYFQPCSPLGGSGPSANSPKIQSIPAFIDVEGYCTAEDDSESDHDEDDTDSDDDVRSGASTSVGERTSPKSVMASQMCELLKEKRRIAMLRDLTDPSFLVSGYLLKQSLSDPYVWRRVYCVLSEDRMWVIGRMKPLKESDTADDSMLSSVRVGRHKYIKLHRSLLLERGEASDASSRQYSSSRCSGYHLTPLGHRLPHTFRMLTSHGKCHTFRAFNSQSFRVWVNSISENIAQKHGDGMMDLANVIAEEETLARCRRMDDIAVAPIEASAAPRVIAMDVVRFGLGVAAFRELHRHVNDALVQHRNRDNVVNVQTRVGGKQKSAQPSSPSAGQRMKNAEHIAMVTSVWEDARVVASKSAQLLHSLATLEHGRSNNSQETADRAEEKDISFMKDLIEEQKGVQTKLGKHWDLNADTANLPPMKLFDPLLEKLQASLRA